MRIAIVNDMAMAVEALRRVVCGGQHGYELAWVAKDGAEAVERCAADRPDVILMDLIMPRMDGVEATRRIMAQSPCAILVVTATVTGNISLVFDAMGGGALDAVCTPVLGAQGGLDGAEPLLSKLDSVAKLLGKPSAAGTAPQRAAPQLPILLALGASTGGPQALAEILSAIPADALKNAAIIIVQHVDAQFASGMADWLNDHSSLPVAVAPEGHRPKAGDIWLAKTKDHLVVKPDGVIGYTPHPKDNNFRPSVDVFFESAAKNWPGRNAAVLLTGMGKDGAQGLLALRIAGWHTIAQDEKSSVLYGMPKAAKELGAAIEVLPLKEIAPRLVCLAGKRHTSIQKKVKA